VKTAEYANERWDRERREFLLGGATRDGPGAADPPFLAPRR